MISGGIIIISIIGTILIIGITVLITVLIMSAPTAPTAPMAPAPAAATAAPHITSPDYKQIGVLTSSDTDPIILPLYGKPVPGRSDRWYYYTASDSKSGTLWKVPIKVESRDCQDPIGCTEIYQDDKVEIPIYNQKEFKATIYKYDTPRYNPFL